MKDAPAQAVAVRPVRLLVLAVSADESPREDLDCVAVDCVCVCVRYVCDCVCVCVCVCVVRIMKVGEGVYGIV